MLKFKWDNTTDIFQQRGGWDELRRRKRGARTYGTYPEPLDVSGGEVVGVVGHLLGAAAVDREDLEAVRVGVHQGQHRNLQLVTDLAQEQPRRHVRLTFAGDHDAGVFLVKPVLGQTDVNGLFFDQNNELRVAADVCDAVDVWGNGFACDTHLGAVDEVAGLPVLDATHHQALPHSKTSITQQ
jgi:hypothetical protein